MESVIAPPLAVEAALSGAQPGATSSGSSVAMEAGYGANIGSDVVDFAGALERAATSGRVAEPSAAAEAMFAPLDFIDGEAASLVEYAQSAVSSGNELTPGEIVMLTARSQEFMFHAQLTSNVANRTAEGLQQLFRQQS